MREAMSAVEAPLAVRTWRAWPGLAFYLAQAGLIPFSTADSVAEETWPSFFGADELGAGAVDFVPTSLLGWWASRRDTLRLRRAHDELRSRAEKATPERRP